eukprot:328147_1
MSISTRKQLRHLDDNSDKLVFGYIHHIESNIFSNTCVVPIGITQMIVSYYVLTEQFDMEHHGEQIIVTPTTATNQQYGWSNVYGSIIIDQQELANHILTWTIRIHAKADPVLEVGIVDVAKRSKDDHETNINYFVEAQSFCYGLYVTSYSNILDSHDEASTNAKTFGKIRIQPNSSDNVIQIHLDVSNATLTYCMNGRSFGVAMKGIDFSAQYVFCASLMKQDISIEIDAFEIKTTLMITKQFLV